MKSESHEKYLKIALEEAKKSGKDVPVGAVLVKNNEIIARAHNTKETDNDPAGHAEMIVIREAAGILNNWRLDNTILYVTLEPCPMCASAILYSRIPEIVFGATDQLYGAFGSVLNMADYINFQPRIVQGILEEHCSELLKTFFEKVRRGN
ncbi:MAG: tRNA-specific adenosine deaminase [Candidatus Lokiarchaeota archaeon]|nr:tRNA-specific adenosine deaminase [Candidatus Lokiarchaeota archaeon]